MNTNEQITCPCCGKPAHQFEQMGLIPNRPAHHMVECHTNGCALHMITLDREQFIALTPAQIEGYVRSLQAVR